MSWKSIACVAALGALTAPALAVPSISVVDNGSGTGSLFVTTTATGSIGAELTLALSGATLGGATINSGVFDTANPGDNPFVPGSPIGGDANGLVLDLANNRLFASFGSGSQVAGQYKLLDFTYTGSGTATGDGFVGFGALLEDVAAAVTPIGAAPPQPGDFSGDGKVDAADFNLLLGNWGAAAPPAPSGWNGVAPTAPAIDADEFNLLLGNWGAGTSLAVAIPEPTSAVLALLGLACISKRRSA